MMKVQQTAMANPIRAPTANTISKTEKITMLKTLILHQQYKNIMLWCALTEIPIAIFLKAQYY